MAFCKACGQEIGTATFCPKCGANQSAAAVPVAAPVASPTEGLQENVAGLLCYVLGWVTGIIFLLIDKRPFVRFHAAQSIVVFGGLTIIRIALIFMHGILGGIIGFGLFGINWDSGLHFVGPADDQSVSASNVSAAHRRGHCRWLSKVNPTRASGVQMKIAVFLE